MKNNFKFNFILIFLIFFIKTSFATEIFNFDVTEVEIKENGNLFIGKKGGIAKSKDGIKIKAKNFEYDKSKNILIALGNVKIEDEKDDVVIYSNKITYYKNIELVITEGNSRAVDKETEIKATQFNYNKLNV